MMLRGTFFENPAYCQYARLLAHLHDLIVAGRDDEREGDELRAKMDVCGEGLTDNEVFSLQGLSGDLYSLHEPAGVPPPQVAQSQNDLADSLNAAQSGDLVTALALVRKSRNQIEPSQLSYLRGRFLSDAGLADLAFRFFNHASELEPTNDHYRSVILDTLRQFDVAQARKRASEILVSPEKYTPVLALKAAEIRYESKRDVTPAAAAEIRRGLIPVLTRIIVGLESKPTDPVGELVLPMAYLFCGFCNQGIGDIANARRCFDLAIRLRPNDVWLRTARGILLYGRDSTRAVSDFEQAVALNARTAWPYFFLAHHYLVAGRYSNCLEMCEQACRFPVNDKARANCFEWVAICQSTLGYDTEIVRESFSRAARLAPDNHRISKNRDAFEAHVAGSSVGTILWDNDREEDVRELGQDFGNEFQLAA